MTITAPTPSATDQTLFGEVEPDRYAALPHVGLSYALTSNRPSFRLAVALHGDTWTVTDRKTGIYGAGDSVPAAWSDFRHAVHEHLDVLERQNELSEALRAQLDYLRARIAA